MEKSVLVEFVGPLTSGFGTSPGLYPEEICESFSPTRGLLQALKESRTNVQSTRKENFI
jgi:hypothetical protein